MDPIYEQVLNSLSNSLFRTNKPLDLGGIDLNAFLHESMMQAVFPLVYWQIKTLLPENEDVKWKNLLDNSVRNSVQVEYQHGEVHRLMTENNIPYVVLKGYASGYYYPETALRTYGDVDFLVRNEDIQRAGEVLLAEGFSPTVDDNGNTIHVAYHRYSNEAWEMHRSINGIPAGKCGDEINKMMADIFETAIPISSQVSNYRIPDAFHHGMVLLLHTASHLTSEGVGLRHLCDWSVFVQRVPNFEELFKEKLQKCGLWKFAQMLTLVSSEYLGLPEQLWAGDATAEMKQALIEDILEGGNFGRKNVDRFAQIKYIKNQSDGSVDSKSAARQVLNTIKTKAQKEHKSMLGVVVEYLKMVLRGERKLDDKKVVNGAARRKKLYSELKLFE